MSEALKALTVLACWLLVVWFAVNLIRGWYGF